MGYDVVVEIYCSIGNIFVLSEMIFSGGDDRLGFFLYDVVNYGEIVRGEVPYYVHIVLEKTQIDPHRVIVVDISQRSVIYKFFDLPYRTGEEECVIDHYFQILPFR